MPDSGHTRRPLRGAALAVVLLLATSACELAGSEVPPPAAAAPRPAAAAPTISPPQAVHAPLEPFEDGETLAEVIVPREWLVLPSIDGRGRRPFRPDAVLARYLVEASSAPPEAGEELRGELGDSAWLATTAGADGALDLAPLHGAPLGWAWCQVWSEAPRVMLAEARGAGAVFVNGAPVPGDLYALGTPGLPVALRSGRNDVFVSGARGGVSLRLVAPPWRLYATAADATCPDLVDGERPPPGTSAAVLVVNASLDEVPQLVLESGGPLPDGTPTPFARVAPPTRLSLPPLGVLKVPVGVVWDAAAAPPGGPGELLLPVRVGGHPVEDAPPLLLPLAVRAADAARRVTYVSPVDRSVQEFSLAGPQGAAGPERPGMVLTLHGAGVDAMGHLAAYSRKPDFWLCAPTNRRAFGFDWQDWGRRDAYDALSAALAISGADPARVMLTGHSMGGHGAWLLAANDPDRFAALAPSAGWRSFDTYGSRPSGALGDLWRGADGASDVPALAANLAQQPVFILHGEADDNVPVSEARAMEQALVAAGGAPQAHYEPGAGHWWDGEAAPGADCVDWPGLFELFRSACRPADPDVIDWTTTDPSVDARHHWVVALQPLRYGESLHVVGERRAADDEIVLATRNVRRLAVFWPQGRPPARLRIDDQLVPRAAWTGPPARHGQLLLEGGAWRALPDPGPPPGEKSPERSGPFKRAFDNGFLLVHGTGGDRLENPALLARARADAAEWWYRGNGHAPVLADREFMALAGTAEFAGRNVILYGNADTNAAWGAVLGADCPIEARRGFVRAGERRFSGVDLGAVFVWPRAGEPRALVGVFADSGALGTWVLDSLSPFTSGVGYTDWAVIDARVLRLGDGGVLAAGWFDAQWRIGEVRSGQLR